LAETGERSGIARLLGTDPRDNEIRRNQEVADSIERIIGSVYCDGGLDAALRVVDNIGIFDKKRDDFQHYLNHDNGNSVGASKKIPIPDLECSTDDGSFDGHVLRVDTSRADVLEDPQNIQRMNVLKN